MEEATLDNVASHIPLCHITDKIGDDNDPVLLAVLEEFSCTTEDIVFREYKSKVAPYTTMTAIYAKKGSSLSAQLIKKGFESRHG